MVTLWRYIVVKNNTIYLIYTCNYTNIILKLTKQFLVLYVTTELTEIKLSHIDLFNLLLFIRTSLSYYILFLL